MMTGDHQVQGAARSAIRRVFNFNRSLRRRIRTVGRASGVGSKVALTRMLVRLTLAEALQRGRAPMAAETAEPIQIKDSGRRTVWLRPQSYDPEAFVFSYRGLHLPPPELTGPVRHVAVFGAYIGLLLADLGRRFPEANLLGVEPDRDNAAVARLNLADLADRCCLLEEAVSHRDEDLALVWNTSAWGQTGGGLGQNRSDITEHAAIGAERILDEFCGAAVVDYFLINIDTGWHELLKHGEWTQKVRCIKIEIYDRSVDEAVPLLESLGYRAWLQRVDYGAFAVGIADDRMPITSRP